MGDGQQQAAGRGVGQEQGGEPVDVAEVVQQAVADLTISSEVGIYDLTGLRAVADASHLRQVLGNRLAAG